jgi:hypothetical protein
VLSCSVFWLYASISEEHTASIFRADSQNITHYKSQQSTIYIHITIKTSNITYHIIFTNFVKFSSNDAFFFLETSLIWQKIISHSIEMSGIPKKAAMYQPILTSMQPFEPRFAGSNPA